MKKTMAFVLAMIMAFSLCISVFAESAEPAAEEVGVYEFELTPGEDGVISFTRSTIDQTWTFTGSHQGSDRVYSSNSLTFRAKITDSNGNALDDEVAIDLHDYYGNTQYYTAYADGAWYGYSGISIISGDTYYFTYENLSSSTHTLKIRMIIYD